MNLKCLFLLLLFSSFPCLVQSKEVVLENNKEHYFIRAELEFFYDSIGDKTIEDVNSGKYNFTNLPFPYLVEKGEKSYWIKFSVRNNRAIENNAWYFESWGFDIDSIEFYIPDKEGGFIKSEMGFNIPFSAREVFHKNFLFLITISKNETLTYYIKMKRSHPMHLNFLIRSHKVLIKHIEYEYWYLGIFYGIFVLIIILNVYLWIVLKESIYLYYLVLVTTEVLYSLGRDGMGFQFIWPSFPWLNYYTYHNVTQFLLIFSMLTYALHFLKLREKQPVMYTLTLISLGLKAVLFMVYFIVPISPFIVFCTDALILTIPLISGIYALHKGEKYVRFYVIAFSCLFVSFILIILEERQLLPFMILNYYMINIGMMLEAIFLAIALIDQIRIYRTGYEVAMERSIVNLKETERLKDKINQNLERKVEARTAEIEVVLVKLRNKNKELNGVNVELAELNQKINHLNTLLGIDNEKLIKDNTELNKSWILAKDVTFDEFKKVFSDDAKCLNFLSDLKWKDGYQCTKCGYKKATMDENLHVMRCRNCNYKESATTDTLFHKLKFPITKAFYLVYLVTVKDKSHTLEELSAVLDLRRETCWSFRKKILLAKVEADRIGGVDPENGWASLALISLNKS